jgi:ribosomal protein S6-L-glutamate ligase RimK-like protein
MSDLAAVDAHLAEPRQVSHFEFWPSWIFYAPVVAYWIALGLRYRDFSLPSAANPRISTGGLCGESKSSILDQAGPIAAPWIAPYVRLRTGEQDGARAAALMEQHALSLPIVVKPDIGCNGTGVRLAETKDALSAVLAGFPRDTDILLQELVPFEGEAGIFYIRHPQAAAGTITSLTHKKAPILFGDGTSTIHDLIMADPRTSLVPHLYLPRLRSRLHEVPRPGAPIRLVFAGNHCKGSIFANGELDITPALSKTIDQIMSDIPDFHFGRVDVRYQNVASLRRGTGFRIIEINGVGSEATHIWDPATRLRDAYRIQFDHYRQAFQIGAALRATGVRSSGVLRMFKDWRHQRRLMASYPMND